MDTIHPKFFKKKANNFPDKILPSGPGHFQADLKIMPEIKGFKYVLFMVSVSTRLTYAYIMKNKDADSTIAAFTNIIRRQIRNRELIRVIHTDHGAEFIAAKTKQFLASKDIALVLENTLTHYNSTAIVDRMISTLTNYVHQFITTEKKKGIKNPDWRPMLSDVITYYNLHVRRTFEPLKIQQLIKTPPLIPPLRTRLKIGEHVYVFKPAPLNEKDKEKLKFRNGVLRFDNTKTHVITHYLLHPARPLRYFLDGNKSITYGRNELLAKKELN